MASIRNDDVNLFPPSCRGKPRTMASLQNGDLSWSGCRIEQVHAGAGFDAGSVLIVSRGPGGVFVPAGVLGRGSAAAVSALSWAPGAPVPPARGAEGLASDSSEMASDAPDAEPEASGAGSAQPLVAAGCEDGVVRVYFSLQGR